MPDNTILTTTKIKSSLNFESSKQNDYFPAIDLFKFIMAIAVVAIHTLSKNTIELGIYYKTIVTMSVPFFFMASSFLLFTKNDCKEKQIESLKKYINSFFITYLKWTLIYLPITIYFFYQSHTGTIKAVLVFLYNILVKGSNNFSYHLWYLLSTAYGASILLLLFKKNISVKKIILIIPIFFVLIQYLLLFFKDSMGSRFNSFANDSVRIVLSGLFYMSLGLFFSKIYKKNKLFSLKSNMFGLVLCFIVSVFFHEKNLIMPILLNLFFFAFVLNLNSLLSNIYIYIYIYKAT